MRLDIINKSPKPLLSLMSDIFAQEGLRLENLIMARSYWIESEKGDLDFTKDLLCDPVDERLLYQDVSLESIAFDYLIEVSFKPGVTDNRARSTKEAIDFRLEGQDSIVATGEIFFLKSKLNFDIVTELSEKYLANPLIQRIKIYRSHEVMDYIPSPSFPIVNILSEEVKTYNLNISDEELLELSQEKLWALSLSELHQIKEYYQDEKTQEKRKELNLPKEPTDIEIEIIAQSWSEHCKHKIFSSNIEYTEDESVEFKLGSFKVESIFNDYIKKATRDVKEKFKLDWLISVFSDNAGIVRFDSKIDYALKVETHNSPSALDPYGGALTGILGVNRDILGVGLGAMPVANTNVLCFAPLNYSKEILEKLPKKLKNPNLVLKGVHKGIEDGGNKSGVPTVNGAIHFHDNYAGKPLVYCGTVGVLPQKINEVETHKKDYYPGDYIVICGGSVGADGVHGATFSSLEMDDNAPATAVQIGDPFTQRRLTDFLLIARDNLLYRGITDNGAGGLSSSIGEMAEFTNGAEVHLEKIPLKYQGLSPYEIIISESQERMSFAVSEKNIDAFMALAQKMKVNPAIIGNFHARGSFDIKQNDKLISSLDLNFLHESLKPMQLTAKFAGAQPVTSWHQEKKLDEVMTLNETIISLIRDPNIKSKEKLVRQFDHEVKAATIVKPFQSAKLSSPSDAAVLWSGAYGGDETGAVAVGCGMYPQASHIDTYYMTQMSIDEAIRNVVASGANPDFISLCDNFCWPDPIESASNPDGAHKLAQLVRSAKALYNAAMIYGTPFISGKDSMKNDFKGIDPSGLPLKISVPPTLLITALAKLDHVEDFMTSDFKEAGALVYYVGPDFFQKTYFSTYLKNSLEHAPINMAQNKDVFGRIHSLIKARLIQSAHDVSEGGIITSLIESCFCHELGFDFDSQLLKEGENLNALLFNELSGGFVISLSPTKEEEFKKLLGPIKPRFLGKINDSGKINYLDQIELTTNELYQYWSEK